MSLAPAGTTHRAQRRVLIIAPYFLPSNLAGVQRIRLLAGFLSEFGWDPTVITVAPEYYEGPLDVELMKLIAPNVNVVRVKALPARLCRSFGIGDLSVRGHWWLKREVERQIESGKVDLIFVSILPGYSSLIGAWAKRRHRIPFILDYQDPWVSEWGARQPLMSKAGLSHLLAVLLERRVVPVVDSITAVSEATVDGLRSRGLLKPGVPVKALPIGVEENDHEAARARGKSAIERSAHRRELVYVGSVNDSMMATIKTVFKALKVVKDRAPDFGLRITFVGTSGVARGTDSLGLQALANSFGVGDDVVVLPGRIDYLDALRTMQDADALLLAGTEFAHYTASKIFPYWLSGKPVIGLFHEMSTVFDIAKDLGGISVIPYGRGQGPAEVTSELAEMLSDIDAGKPLALPPRNLKGFEKYTARGIARQYAEIFDNAVK